MDANEVCKWLQAEESTKLAALRQVAILETRVEELEKLLEDTKTQASEDWQGRAIKYRSLYQEQVRMTAADALQALYGRFQAIPNQGDVFVEMTPPELSHVVQVVDGAVRWSWASRATVAPIHIQTSMEGLRLLETKNTSGITILEGERELRMIILAQDWLWAKGQPAGS